MSTLAIGAPLVGSLTLPEQWIRAGVQTRSGAAARAGIIGR